MNRPLPFLLVPAFWAMVGSALASPSVGTVSPAKLANSTLTCDVLSPPAVTVGATGADWVRAEVWGDYTPNGGHGAVHVYLSKSGNNWTGTLPVDRAGTMSVRFTAGNDATGETTTSRVYSYKTTENTTSADALGPARRPVWSVENPFYTAWNGTTERSGTVAGWTGTFVRMPSGRRFISLYGSAFDEPEFQSQIGTENSLSVGSIWFKTQGYSTNAPMTLVVERVNGTTRETIQTIEIPARSSLNDVTWTQHHIVLESGGAGRINFRNATRSSSADRADVQIRITDIVITPPQPDVKIYRLESDYEPGFPSVQDPVTFRCAVSNEYPAAAAGCLTPKLVWRQNGGDWNVSAMTNVAGRTVQGDGVYAVTLTDHVPGSFEYFFRADFAGYTPTFEAVNPDVIDREFGVTAVTLGTWGDHIAFNVAETDANVVSLVDPLGEVTDFDADAKAMLSRSPEYSYNLYEWQERGAAAANLGDYIYRAERTETVPIVTTWELSHRFDFENLRGGYVDSLPVCSAAVAFEDIYKYSTLLAAEGVRRFRSRYKTISLSVANHPSATEPSNLEPSYPMQQVGDYTWQAIVRLTNAVDFAATVRGEWEYIEEYDAINNSTFRWGEIGQEPTAINPPMAGNLYRVGSYETAPSGWAPSRIQLSYTGFLMFRFCTTNGAYQVRRAAWQDFNAWQADDDWFARSFGLYGTQTFETTTDDLDATIDNPAWIEGLNQRTPVSSAIVTRDTYRGGMMARNFWYVKERFREVATNYTASAPANFAWRLSTSEAHPGSLETTGASRGDGRGVLKMRVRASTDDDRAILYNVAEATSWQNKRFVGKFSGAKLSPGLPSYSVYGYWRDPDNYWEARVTQTNRFDNPGSNVTPTTANTQTAGLVLELFLKENGVKNRVATSAIWYDRNNAKLDRTGDTLLVLDLRTPAAGSVTARAYVLYNSNFINNNKTGQPGAPNNILRIGVSGATSPAPASVSRTTTVDGGTVGYNMRDCEATLVPYVFEWHGNTESNTSTTDEFVKSNGSANFDNKAVSTSTDASWVASAHDGLVVYQGESPWTVTHPNGATLPNSPSTVKRSVHDANYRVLVYRTGEEESSESSAPAGTSDDAGDWDGHWDAIHGHEGDAIRTISSFDWTDVEIPMSLWDDAFIKIETCGTNAAGVASTADLMVDDIFCTGWTGQTVYSPQPPTWEDQTVLDEAYWKSLYATVEKVVVSATTNNYYTLDRTRMNPNVEDRSLTSYAPQSITTPYLENGVGDLYFSYKVEGGDVAFVVEHLKTDGSFEEYFSTTATVDSASAWVPKYVPILDASGGRIRIRTKRLFDENDNEIFGRLLLDDIRATDYPNDEESSWESYNVLVSTFRSPSGIHANMTELEYLAARFDGPADPERRRSAVLNDSATADTVSGNVFGEHRPFIQTPMIATGIGEVSFWYRRSPDATAAPVSLKLMVSTAASPVDSDWRELTINDLNPNSPTYAQQCESLNALSSIENSAWVYFTAEFCLKDYKVLRLVGETNGANRVMLDNVLVTEPVRSSIDVGSITFDPVAPVVSDDVGVRVKLVNPRMQPENISVTLEYFRSTKEALFDEGRGTNWWGYAKWRDDPRKGTIAFTNAVTKLFDGTSRVEPYAFVSSERIPHFNVDDIVQYCAVVNYEGTFAAPVYSELQERLANTFWFENPEWYKPTDLNAEFGTSEKPVAHYWVFSCPPGTVWINEFRNITNGDGATDAKSRAAQRGQYVEIIGPEGASLAGWTLEHFGEAGGAPSLNYVKWTNTVTRTAFFTPPNNAASGNPKGWGFWTLGCADVPTANQELFPVEETQKPFLDLNHGVMHYRGAMRLKRSMGAYVDKVVWARNDGDISQFLEAGFRRAAYSQNAETTPYVVVDTDTGEAQSIDDLGWMSGSVSIGTIGGYNPGEEAGLWVAGSYAGGGNTKPWLFVTSEFGEPDPMNGVHYLSWGNEVFASVVTPAPTNGVRHVSTGWTGTGSVPANGTGTNVTFKIRANSTLVWNWRKENQISVSVSGAGTCEFGTQWIADGETVTAEIVPTTHLYDVALSGDTEGVTLDGTTLTIPANRPRSIAVTVSEIRIAFAVESEQGMPAPTNGVHFLSWGAEVPASVVTPEPTNGVRHVCTGWTGTGSVPESGTETNVTFTIKADSTLVWNWRKENQITVSVTGDGTCDFGTQWIAAGETATAEILPSTHLYDIALSGDTEGVTLDGTTLTIPANKPRNIRVSVYEIPEAPVISPEGGVVAVGKGITMSCATEGATIHYTTDGTDPTVDSPSYRRFRISERTTVKAIAVKNGFVSEVTVAEFALGRCADPVVTAASTFTGTKTLVSLSCTTENAVIRYTLDGSPPDVGSAVYSAPFYMTRSCTVKVYATYPNYFDSAVVSFAIEKVWGIGDTMGDPDQVFTTGGDVPFFRVTDATAPLGESMRSGAITHNQTSTMTTTVEGPGTVSFQWKTSCEDSGGAYDWDHAEFEVDGAVVAYLDGESDWQTVSHEISGDGSHTLLWRYVKDDVESEGEDCCWVADFRWTPNETPASTETQTTPEPVPYSWLDADAATILAAHGGDYEAAAKATAANGVNKVWECYVAGISPTNAAARFEATIEMGADGKPVVSWTPDLNEGGKKSERVYRVLGAKELGAAAQWDDVTDVEDPDAEGYRFFKAAVEMP